MIKKAIHKGDKAYSLGKASKLCDQVVQVIESIDGVPDEVVANICEEISKIKNDVNGMINSLNSNR